MTASEDCREAAHLLQELSATLCNFGKSRRFFGAPRHQVLPANHVGRRIEEDAFRGYRAVTAGAAGLLLVGPRIDFGQRQRV